MKRILTIIGLLFGMFAALQAQTSIRVDVQNIVAQDEQFNVTFIIEGEDRPSNFSWDPGSDFQLVWGPQSGSSTSVSIVNGKRTRSSQYTYTYILSPKRAGKFTLPTATATVDGKTISSRAASVEVVAGGASSGGRPSGGSSSQGQNQAQQTGTISDNDLFMRLTLSRNDVVLGEPVTATLKLYQRVDIAGFEDAKFPTFNGFWSQEVEAPTNINFSREVIGDEIYNSAVLRRWVLIPQQTGQVTIDPAELVCLVNIRVQSRSNSIFDGFFEDNVRRIRKRVTAPSPTVHVRSLPAGAPASFGGGVGNFTMTTRLSKDSLKTHDAASLIVTVTGRGNIALLQAPQIRFPSDFEVYDVKTTESADRSAGGTSGSKTFEYPFIPRSYGDFTIPPVEYSYYDVSAGRYVTLTSEPLEVKVARGTATGSSAAVEALPSVERKDVRNLGEDIRFIRTAKPVWRNAASFFVARPLYWLLLALLLAGAVALWAAMRRNARLRSDVTASRNRGATKMAMKRLKLSKEFLDKNLQTAFYEELHRALLGFVSDKLGMQVEDLSRDNITAQLQGSGVSAELTGQFADLLDACEYARYAPSAETSGMDSHYQTAVRVISSIDASMKRKPSSSAASAVLALLLLALPAGSVRAADNAYADSLWTAGVTAYQDGRWTDALAAFEALTATGTESAQLYYNLGNAAYKAGEIPQAILNYERALKVDPSFDDARVNLEFVNTRIQDKIDVIPEFFLKAWVRKLCYALGSNAWAWLSLLLFAGALSLLLLFLLGRTASARRTGFFGAIVAALLFAGALGFALWQHRHYVRADSAIVMRPVSSVKSSPSAGTSSKDLFVLHEGTKVGVLDVVGDWCNISLSDGRQGWIPTTDIEII